MDNAVAFVQTYLRLNGYFTVSEHPVIARGAHAGYRTVTDLDILAIRLGRPRQGPLMAGGGVDDDREPALDPVLDPSPGEPDMIIGEVKEGRAVLNAAATDSAVVAAALRRFGCCGGEDLRAAVTELLRYGRARLPNGHRVRLVAFGSSGGSAGGGSYQVITHGHVLEYLTSFLKTHWDALRHGESKDPVLGMLMLLEKARRTDRRPARRAPGRTR